MNIALDKMQPISDIADELGISEDFLEYYGRNAVKLKFGAPKGWILTVTDAHLVTEPGFIVVIAGNMPFMPGLSKTPQAIILASLFRPLVAQFSKQFVERG